MRSGARLALLFLVWGGPAAAATVFDVGPGRPFPTIGTVPWESLSAGDRVRIHWRPEPYREKWVIGRQGTASAPIVVQGVPGPDGERPIVRGDGATTRPELSYWNEVRGLIKIGGSSIPPNTVPEHIVIEGLELRSAHPDYGFTDDDGIPRTYASNAAGIYVEYGRHITVRDCVIHDNGNGIFVGSPSGDPTRDLLIEGNFIHGNGIVGSFLEHNSYTEALGIVFEDNHYGPLRPGAEGNNLKDRSAGTVVRYNRIEAGNRQLDLVDSTLGSVIEQDPSYRQTHVYGNVLVETEGAGNRQMVHYGGDGGAPAAYRKGTLHFYNNTLVSERAGRTTLFRLSTTDETADARNNVVYLPNAPGSELELVSDAGTLDWTHNWLEPGWSFSFFGTLGTFNDAGTTVEGTDPGFIDAATGRYRLQSGSDLADAGTTPHASVLPTNGVVREPSVPTASAPRPTDGILDIGAFELPSGLPAEVSGVQMYRSGAVVWQLAAAADEYEIARGEIAPLSGAVDLAASQPECAASALTIRRADDPSPVADVWFLVRARNAIGPGTWGSGRDAAIGATCP